MDKIQCCKNPQFSTSCAEVRGTSDYNEHQFFENKIALPSLKFTLSEFKDLLLSNQHIGKYTHKFVLNINNNKLNAAIVLDMHAVTIVSFTKSLPHRLI